MGSLVAGCILVFATYFTMRMLGCRRISAIFTTWMVMCDHLITVDSRLILTDVYLWMFHMLTIGSSFALTRAKSTSKSLLLAFVTGILLGCTVSVKYTAFGTIGMVGFHQAIYVLYATFYSLKKNALREPSKRTSNAYILFYHFYFAVWKALIILVIAAVVFCCTWYIHLQLLPYSGQGDGFMDPRFNSILQPYFSAEEKELAKLGGCPNHANSWYDCGFPTINEEQCIARGCCWDPTSTQKWCYPKFAPPVAAPRQMSFFSALSYMLEATWKNNQGEELNYHPQMSRWWQWPLLTCKFVDFGFGIYSMGNPAVWWLVALIVALSLLALVLLLPLQFVEMMFNDNPSKDKNSKKIAPVRYSGGLPAWLSFFVLVVGYLGNWMPFYLIERSTWNYHYMLALLIGIILVGAAFDFLIRYFEHRNRIVYLLTLIVMAILAILMGVAFWYWSPWIYGTKISAAHKESLRWHHLWGV